MVYFNWNTVRVISFANIPLFIFWPAKKYKYYEDRIDYISHHFDSCFKPSLIYETVVLSLLLINSLKSPDYACKGHGIQEFLSIISNNND